MEFGICLNSVAPLRAEPAHRSEMVSQILFGELFRVTAREPSWLKIVVMYDQYEGWLDENQAFLIDEQEFNRLQGADTFISADLVQIISANSFNKMIPIVAGSSLPSLYDNEFSVGQENFRYEGALSSACLRPDQGHQSDDEQIIHRLIEDSMLFLHSPYLWGGRSPFGIDCSGFTQMAYKLQGIVLLRDAAQQATQGEVVSLLAEARPGDLAFFDNEEGLITHVGILLDHQRIIHCSGEVKIDPIDHEGIYSQLRNRYTHKLRLIKRVIGN